MEVYVLHGDDETIRAFSAQVTRSVDPKKLLLNPKYDSITVEPKYFHNMQVDFLINYLDKRNHFSTREFNNQYFLILDATRTLSFWLMTKSKHSTFEQQSQRYVRVESSNEAYKKLLDLGIPKEDARYVLPQNTKTNFVMKTNLREIENLIKEFYSRNYPKEIYEFINEVMDIIRIEYPASHERLEELIVDKEREPFVEIKYNSSPSSFYGKLENILIKDIGNVEENLKMSVGWYKFQLSLSAAHQLIRHRELEKVILEIGDGYIIPPKIKNNENALRIYEKAIEDLFSKGSYEYLPNATVVKMSSFENLYKFIENVIGLRTCTAAQWEIRKVVNDVRRQLEEYVGPIPIGRCRFYPRPNEEISEIFPTTDCPEDIRCQIKNHLKHQ